MSLHHHHQSNLPLPTRVDEESDVRLMDSGLLLSLS